MPSKLFIHGEKNAVLQCATTAHYYALKIDRFSQIALGEKKKKNTTRAILKGFNLNPLSEQWR